ncbi:MAG: hypothetical protein ACE5NL_01280 [Candidatus Hydrothermarchaeaceae archaeon]
MAGVIEDYITFVKGPTVPGIWGGLLASEFVAETATVSAGLTGTAKEISKAGIKVGFSLVPFGIAKGTAATGDAELALSGASAVSLAGALQNLLSAVIPGSPGKDPGTEAGQAVGNWIRAKLTRHRPAMSTFQTGYQQGLQPRNQSEIQAAVKIHEPPLRRRIGARD